MNEVETRALRAPPVLALNSGLLRTASRRIESDQLRGAPANRFELAVNLETSKVLEMALTVPQDRHMSDCLPRHLSTVHRAGNGLRWRVIDVLELVAEHTCPSGCFLPTGYIGATRRRTHSPALTPSICGG